MRGKEIVVRTIIKLNDRYLVWSSIADAPLTKGMDLKALEDWWRWEYGESGMEKLPEMLARVERTGSSSLFFTSVEDVIAGNRAGEYERELTKQLKLTPYSLAEYEATQTDISTEKDPIERARLLFVRAYMGYNGYMSGRKLQFRRPGPTAKGLPQYFQTAVSGLEPVTERLLNVVIEEGDARKVMQFYDGENTLHYLDPPYHPETRTCKGYSSEFDNDGQEDLLKFIMGLKGKVVISGYDCDLYNDVLVGWRKETAGTHRTIGIKYGTSAMREETIWLSPNCEERQISMF